MTFDELIFLLSVNVLSVPSGPKKLSVSLSLRECVNDRSLFQSNVPLHLTAPYTEVLRALTRIPLPQTSVKDKRITNSKNDWEEALGINQLSGI